MNEDDIRAALADEAANAVPGSVVIERLRAPRRSRGGLVALVAASVVAAVGAVVIPLTAGRDPAAPPAAPPAPAAASPVTVVVVGTDERRADTVMLLRLDGGRVSALSLPRDTWVTVPGRGRSKLNSTFERHGPDVLVDVVADLTGQRVDHWAAVDMAGFERLATAVGGVEVCLRAATSDRFAGADFRAGRQTVTGAAALAFVRQRHGLPNGDLDRVVRQQVFVRGLVDKLVTTVLTDPVREAELSELVRSVVRTDPGWSPVALAAQATGPVRAATIPIADAEFQTEAGFALEVEPAEVRRFAAGFFAPTPSGSTPPGSSSPGSGGDGCVN